MLEQEGDVAQEGASANRRLVLLRCGKLYDGSSPSVLERAAVLIQGTRILAVGPEADVKPPPGAEVDEWVFDSAFAVPGLIDAHTHVSLPADGRAYEQMMSDSDELMALVGAANLDRHLRAGVTTIRDNGARGRVGFALREGLRRGYIRGPRALFAGRPITCSGGHCHFMNAVADGPDAVRREVRTLVHEGADFIKIMATGGGTAGTLPGCASYTVHELRAAVEEAHSFGKLTATHARAKAGMVNAALARLDLLEHAQFLDLDMVPRFDPKVAELVLEAGAFVGPTLQACTRHNMMIRLLEKEKSGGLSEKERQHKSEYQERREVFLGLFHELLNAGFAGRIVAGSDSGCGGIAFGHLVYDLELMVVAGMTNVEALQAATSVAARAIGLGDLVGSIEPAKEADLLVVNGDPLVSIADLNRVVAVIKGGVRIV